MPTLARALDLADYRVGVLGLCYFASAAVVAVIVALVLASRASGRARTAFAVNVGLVATVLVAMGLTRSAGDAEQAAAVTRLGMFAVAGIGPSTLSFVCALTGWRRQLRGARVMAWLVGAVIAGLAGATDLVVAGASPEALGFMPQAGPLLPLALVHLVTALGLALAICADRARATVDPVERQQLRAVLVAYAVGSLGTLDVLGAWHVPLPPTSFVWLTAAVGILAAAMRSHQLLDAPDLGWRALGWLGTSLLVAVPVGLFLFATAGWRGWSHPLLAAATLYLVFLALDGWARRVQPAIDDRFLRRHRDLEREIEACGDRLLVVQAAESLAADVARLLADTLFVRRAALAVREDDGTWRIAGPAGARLPAPRDDDPWLRTLADRAQPVTRAEALAEVPGPARDAAARLFGRHDAAAIVPLTTPAGLFGVLAVGGRPDGKPFVPVELAFLRRLGALVAAALASTRLYDRRHRLKAALEAKVAARAAEIEGARARLLAAQGRLVDGEKMATLGLVVGGVAAELEAAVDEIAAEVPGLAADVEIADAAAARALAVPAVAAVAEEAGVDYVREDIRPVVASIAEGARRARAIAGGLRRFARPGDTHRVPVDLRAEIDAAAALVARDAGDRVAIVRDDAPGLAPVLGDPGPIGQVLTNLLLNAVQAIDGPGTIVVRTRDVEGGVEIAVRDTGKGIAAEHLPHIFEPFFTTKELGPKGGTGLGLAISYGIVKDHGGAFTVESEVGVGTEIRLVLPAVETAGSQ